MHVKLAATFKSPQMRHCCHKAIPHCALFLQFPSPLVVKKTTSSTWQKEKLPLPVSCVTWYTPTESLYQLQRPNFTHSKNQQKSTTTPIMQRRIQFRRNQTHITRVPCTTRIPRNHFSHNIISSEQQVSISIGQSAQNWGQTMIEKPSCRFLSHFQNQWEQSVMLSASIQEA